MRKTLRRPVAGCVGLALFLAVLLWPGLPWSARCRHTLKRLALKAEVKVAAWQGEQPRPVSLSGRLTGSGAQVAALRGAQVVALESASGYAALSDGEGKFTLPHVTWYPGAAYNLVITADAYQVRRLKVSAPPVYPDDGIIAVGDLRFAEGDEVAQPDAPVRYLQYDGENGEYYQELFHRLTASAETDEQKIDAICRFVATKLNYNEQARSFKNPRLILERGSCYCSNLALAMAAITKAGEYPTRTVHLSDGPQHRSTHVVVEVYYRGG
ncbi:MAG TPA: transglutaminase-like domain-containing protein [Blastocatellia bacterium]|nr:transglutaminase-like domain-containing protein [Blastocatellia bacterium]